MLEGGRAQGGRFLICRGGCHHDQQDDQESAAMVHAVKTIDAHAAGQPLRLVVDGLPRPVGTTIARKQQWMARHAEPLRLALLREPRGHADMTGAMLTEPVHPGSHAGVLFMHAGGYTGLCGHGIIAVATIALERGLVFDAAAGSADEVTLVFDTAAGTIRARARMATHGAARRVDRVAFTNVPSFVCSGGHPVKVGHRELRVDIAFGGGFYVIIDAESVGLAVDGDALPGLRRIAADLKAALSGSPALAHPAETQKAELEGVIFTALPRDPDADLRSVTIYEDLAVDRSPGGTATAAVMAVLDAMGLLPPDRPFVHESLIGTLFRGQVARRTEVGGIPAIVPEIEGSAWITGEHTFLIDDDDPLREGFRIE